MLEKASPLSPRKNFAERDRDTTSRKRNHDDSRAIREIFESDPLIAERMLEELEHSEPVIWLDVKTP